MPKPWEMNWGATPAALHLHKPRQPLLHRILGTTQHTSPACMTGSVAVVRTLRLAQTYNHLLSLQLIPSMAWFRDPTRDRWL